MFHATAFANLNSRSGFMSGNAIVAKQTQVRQASSMSVSARYRGEGTNFSKVGQFKRHENDCGSPEVQIARLSARVEQLTAHLQQHKKDYSTRRGLIAVLSQRKQLMLYLQRTEPQKYQNMLSTLGIRPLK